MAHYPFPVLSHHRFGPFNTVQPHLHNVSQRFRKKFSLVLPVATIALLITVCSTLTSCHSETVRPSIIMETQYYDSFENYIEIPVLTMPDGKESSAGLTAINQTLDGLRSEYQPILDGAVGYNTYGLSGGGNRCLCYPSTTDRYLNLLFLREKLVTDLNSGHVFSLIYDMKEGRQVTVEDALKLASTTQEAILTQLSKQIDRELAKSFPELDLRIQSPTLEGFRIRADHKPVFYLTARVDDADDTVQDAVSGSENLYIWSDGTFTLYDQYAITTLEPLVSSDETDKFNPPLWCQWYFDGTSPEGELVLETDFSARDQLILDYYRQSTPTLRYYYSGKEPGAPQENDIRIDRLIPVGETPTYETVGVAYLVQSSLYQNHRLSTDDPGSFDWRPRDPYYLILGRSGQDGTWNKVRGETYPATGKSVKDRILEVSWGLMDIEVSLWRDGYPQPVGPWAPAQFFQTPRDGTLITEVLDEWEPTYGEGDYWIRERWDDFTSICYFSAERNTLLLQEADTTRTDLSTYRGIRVGDSKESVLAAYPEIRNDRYWDYDGNYLWYCDNEGGFGAAILFYLDENKVSRILLNNMFD